MRKSRFLRKKHIFDPIQPKEHLLVKRKKSLDFEETLIPGEPGNATLESREALTKRLQWMSIAAVLLFGALSIRLFSLQIVSGKQYEDLSFGNRIRIQYEKAPRGIVYDAKKRTLVRNVPSFNLSFVPLDIPKNAQERKDLIERIALVLKVSPADITPLFEDVISYSSEPVLIKENIDREAAMILNANYDKYPGVQVENASRREYEQGPLFAHILGFTGKINEDEYVAKKPEGYLKNDIIGKTGVESVYEDELHGKKAKKQVEVDSLGRLENIIAQEEPLAGKNLQLTIDIDVQKKLTDLVIEAGKKANSSKASAVMLNPNTGEVLALVSLPSFDNNLFAKGISTDEYKGLLDDKDRPMFNRAIAGTYPPGSTIKPVVGSAALQEGIVNTQTVIVDKGAISVPNQYDPNVVYRFVGWKLSGLGPMNIYSAIAQSSDIYFYTVSGGFEKAKGLGAQKLINYFMLFNLGAQVGIDLPHEATGLVPTPEWKEEKKKESWYLGDTYHMGIGQGDLLVTPLQVANYTATIANGGTMYKPHVLKQVIDADGKVVKEIQPVKIRDQIVDPKYTQVIREAMRQTVTSGSGRQLANLPVQAAGKTGTAQFDNNRGTHAWFEAFAPYEHPEVAIVVMVEGGGEGNETAVPVARDMLQWYFERK